NVLGPENWTNWLGALRASFLSELAEECEFIPPIRDNAAQLAEVKNLLERNRSVIAWLAPRGIGLTAWNSKPRDQIQIRRRFMLLGQTLDAMRVWDIVAALNMIRDLPAARGFPITLQADGAMGVN